MSRHVFIVSEPQAADPGADVAVKRLDGSAVWATVLERTPAPPALVRLVLDVPGGIDRAPSD